MLTLEIFMLENSSAKSRPMVYNYKPNKAELYSLVHGNPSQALSVNVPSMAFPIPPRQQNTSLFDRYNRLNLYLRDCDEKDLIPLTKNIVMYEENLSGELAESIARKAEQQRNSNTSVRPISSQKNNSPSLQEGEGKVEPTRQYVQNEILFSYKEMGEIKKKKKQEYLSAIEMMVADAQRQIADIEAIQQQQQEEIRGIHREQLDINGQLNKHLKAGLIQQGLAYITPLEQAKPQTLHIHQQMRPKEINEIIEQHIKLNEDLLERANRARSKDYKPSSGASTQAQKFGQTLKRPLDGPKSAMSTMKDGFKKKKTGKR